MKKIRILALIILLISANKIIAQQMKYETMRDGDEEREREGERVRETERRKRRKR